MISTFELEVKEQLRFEQEYEDWCKKYDINYIVEREEDLVSNPDILDNQKN